MEKVTLEQFCDLAECSKQLVGVYVAKGMPKHHSPENKKKNLYDLSECRDWTIEKGFNSFEEKVDNALMKLCDGWLDHVSKPETIKSDNGKPFAGGMEEIMAMLNTINRKLDDKPMRKRNWKHYSRSWKRI